MNKIVKKGITGLLLPIKISYSEHIKSSGEHFLLFNSRFKNDGINDGISHLFRTFTRNLLVYLFISLESIHLTEKEKIGL